MVSSAAGISLFPQVKGIIPNGALQSGIQVTLNGVGNVLSDRKFFDNWYFSAAMGFIHGAYAGYQLSDAAGANYWWGSKPAYNRSQWSFAWWDKSDVYDFGIKKGLGSKVENDCVPTSFAEIEAKLGGSREYEDFVNYLRSEGYESGLGLEMNKEQYEALIKRTFENVEVLNGSDIVSIWDPAYLQSLIDNNKTISLHFSNHADNIRKVKLYPNPMKNKVVLRNGSYSPTKFNGMKNFRNAFSIF